MPSRLIFLWRVRVTTEETVIVSHAQQSSWHQKPQTVPTKTCRKLLQLGLERMLFTCELNLLPNICWCWNSSSHLMQRADSLKKTLMVGEIEGRRRSGQQRMRWLDGITDSISGHEYQEDSGGRGSLTCCSSWGCRVGHNLATDQQSIISGGFPTYLINGHFCIIICSTHTLYVRNVYMFL